MIRETLTALFAPDIDPTELALALLLGPPLAGFLAGWALRAILGRGGRSAFLAVALLFAIPAAVALLGTRIRLGIWDGASIGLLSALGLVAGLHGWQRRGRELTLTFTAVALTLVAVEWAVRTFAPPAPGFAAIEGAAILLPEIDLERAEPARGDFADLHRTAIDACAMLFPGHYPAHFAERAARERIAAGSVVYVGDSMTYGLGVPMQSAFPALLESRDPRLSHFNLGFPGTSTDFHYVVARRWLDRLPSPVRLVVLGLYFNDILELGQSLPCCGGRAPLAFANDGVPVERCPTPLWVEGYGRSLAWFVRHSPSPYPLRAAMQFSHSARYVEALRAQRAAQASDLDRPLNAGEWDRMREVLAALRDEMARREIALVALLLPSRTALEAATPEKLAGYRDGRRLIQEAASLGIPTYDPWDHFRSLVQSDGSAPYFIGDHDIHLSHGGHAALANWLAAHVAELEAAAR